MSGLGTDENPLRVAVIGSGPSGFYAAEYLMKSAHKVLVDMYERLPAPFGLVRNGVAPDHQKLKQPVLVYDKIAREPGFTYLGNVMVGKDVTVDELAAAYHAVIFANGAETDKKLWVPGEDLPGSHTATEFVGWYNGHPDYRDRVFDLQQEVAVIIGQGNVAADVARILSKTVDELKNTDIAQHALDALANSKVREIYAIGRRGPAQAKFTTKELREFGELADCDASVDPAELVLNPESAAELADKANFIQAKNVAMFKQFAAVTPSKRKRCYFRFLAGPVELIGNGRVEGVVLEKNALSGPANNQYARGTGEKCTLPCGILFRSIGYNGIAMPGVPFDERKGVIPNTDGRIVDANKAIVPGLYVTGWIKRGPSGIIGTNRADSVATCNSLLADLAQLDTGTPKAGAAAIYPLLNNRNVPLVNYDRWLKIDAVEVDHGKVKGKPREKFTRVAEMLAI